MNPKPKISIEEQMYRAGIWERPSNIKLMADAIGRAMAGAIVGFQQLADAVKAFNFTEDEIRRLKKMRKIKRQAYILDKLKGNTK